MNFKLFTSSDLDGVSCGVVCRLFDPKSDITYTTSHEIDNLIKGFLKDASISVYDKIFITDLPISIDTWKNISKHKYAHKFMLIDHHMVSLQLFDIKTDGMLHVGFFDEFGISSASSAEQFYDILKKSYTNTFTALVEPIRIKLVKYLKAVSAWDTLTWIKDPTNELPVRLNMLQSLYTKDLFVKSMVNKLYSDDDFIHPGGEYDIIEYISMHNEKYIERKLSTIKSFKYNEYKMGLVIADDNMIDIANRILKSDKSIDIAIVVNTETTTVYLYSSNTSIDVSVIAKKYGGDGSSQLSTFVYNNDAVNLFIEKIFKP